MRTKQGQLAVTVRVQVMVVILLLRYILLFMIIYSYSQYPPKYPQRCHLSFITPLQLLKDHQVNLPIIVTIYSILVWNSFIVNRGAKLGEPTAKKK